MIEHFLDSTLIIDDKQEEAKPLIEQLEKMDVWVKHFLPEELLARKKPIKHRKLIFLDLYLNEKDSSLAGNISSIRSLFESIIGKDFGNYGLIVWTKHPEDVQDLKDRMEKDSSSYCLPLFIIALAKTHYMEHGYDKLVNDLDKLLDENIASKFFVYWDLLVEKGKNHSIQEVYSLANSSYKTLEKDLQFILYKMAKNQTGIPLAQFKGYSLEDDAIKSITDLLHYDIIHKHDETLKLFPVNAQTNYSGDQSKLFAVLNTKLFMDFKGLDTTVVIPGNVYEILEDTNMFCLDNLPAGATKVVVEITPPCDFSMGKKGKLSRVLGGFYMPKESLSADYNKPVYYNFIKGVQVKKGGEPQSFIFDYRFSGSILETDLLDSKKYILLFRFKDKLFADIIQKSSGHTSRLGIPFMM